MSNFIFIGGIHGAGKGTVCRKICAQTDLTYLNASKVLKWIEISERDNKRVKDISATQNRLVEGLRKYKKDKRNFILDGHFCLLNSNLEVEKVPIETFRRIAPKLVTVVTAEIEIIQDRLRNRDDKLYNFGTLGQMQATEVSYAREIASILNVPFIEIKDGNPIEIINYYQKNLYLTNG